MSEGQRILIVEDEEDIAEFLQLELQHEGYETHIATDGRTGLDLALTREWDMLLLDIMLPNISGVEICRRVRATSDVPIIMLTARHSIPDRVAGLDSGADDYISKPFAIEELLARIRVLYRRVSKEDIQSETLQAERLVLNTASHEVYYDDKPILLTAREYSLLEAFIRNRNHVLTRDQLMDSVWGYDFSGETNVVDVYVRYLRNKIDIPHGTQFIQTVRGVGYMLKV